MDAHYLVCKKLLEV